MTAHDITIHSRPEGTWVVAVDGRVIPLLYENRTQAEDAGRWLLQQHTGYAKTNAIPTEKGSLASA